MVAARLMATLSISAALWRLLRAVIAGRLGQRVEFTGGLRRKAAAPVGGAVKQSFSIRRPRAAPLGRAALWVAPGRLRDVSAS
jgi:hypothetical protein